MDKEANLKAGDVCHDCQQQGLRKHLRYFKINLNGDTLLKCESNECMYPYNDELSSSDEEEITNLRETNSLNFVNDIITKSSNEDDKQNVTNNFQINDNAADQLQFDITFLDDINPNEYANLCKPELPEKTDEISNKLNVENKFLSLPILNVMEPELLSVKNSTEQIDNKILNFSNLCKPEIPEKVDQISDKLNVENKFFSLPILSNMEPELISVNNITEQIDNKISKFDTLNYNDCKQKIVIQSIETIKGVTTFYEHLPTSTKTFTSKISNSNSPTKPQINLLTSSEAVSKSHKNSQRKSKPRTKSTKIVATVATTSNSSVIPKADIMRGNALLKNLAEFNEKPSISIRTPRKKRNAKKDETAKHEEVVTSANTDHLDYSLDEIAKLLSNKRNRDANK